MTINTGISSSIKRPQTFHVFQYQLNGRALVPIDLRVAMIGMKGSTGTATVEVPVPVNDPAEVDGLFQQGSELALMCRKAFETGEKLGFCPFLFAVPVAEPGAGVASIETITVTGTATRSGNVQIRAAGRLVVVGVSENDSQNTVAAAIRAALLSIQQQLPFTPTVATNVVTCTHITKGENGNDVAFSVEATVAGITLALAHPTPGTGVIDLTNSLDALAGANYDGIATANHKAADITDINATIASTWGASEKRWRWCFVAEVGTIGTATALASAANHQGVIVASWEGSPSLPGEISTALAVGAFSRTRPNANYDGLELPLYPPSAVLAYTNAEVETALSAGLTPMVPKIASNQQVIDGVGTVVRLVTTKTTESSQPFLLLADLAVSRVGVAIARQIDARFVAQFGAMSLADGPLLDEDTLDQIGDMVATIAYAAQDEKWIKNVEADLGSLVVEVASAPLGRVNVDFKYTVVMPLHQVAFVHRVTVGG